MKIEIQEMLYSDIITIFLIKNTKDLKKYKNEVIYLYKKYIDETEHICGSCPLEINLIFKKLEVYFKKFLEKRNIIIDNE